MTIAPIFNCSSPELFTTHRTYCKQKHSAPANEAGALELLDTRGTLSGPTLSILDERPEIAATQRVAQLPERLGLDLADALARHLEALADLFERVLALFADAEPEPQDLLLLR